ncbi:VPS10 domain-containing protein [Luteirhabdus pelagi]|uniref:VPS10 domain-containing protein n=1 Tax=Luteirhabdus pelagi TaxID=2792783 RepID=UPI00193954F7|nr:glycosyl hydrolase [Luteirhabdus pelagi]
MKFYLSLLLSLFIFLPFDTSVEAQELSDTELSNLEYRFVGPYRGGRATAVTGIPNQPHTFYVGYTGGGVWKTDDAGHHWTNISDSGIECGSIGSVAVSPISPKTLLVGTGSDSPRGNISPGIGMYKTTDDGKNWKHVGMENCGQIGDIIYDPKNPNIVYAAALGNIFEPNPERGVYKSTDGGDTWKQVFFLNDKTGAIDIALHPEDSNIIYAGMWRAERKPWTLIDGGETGGLYKSTDAGKTWNRIFNGLPKGLVGKIGIAISPVNPDRIWVIQQTAKEEDGGVYRSDDGGDSFKRINRNHKLRQRGWYYSRIFADPQDENTVYVTNTGFYKSIDGGNTFDTRFNVPHGDCHAVWINPNNPKIIANTNDGGGTISINGGKTWSTPNNQPTAELYRLTVDNQFPYRLYAGQQDNTTIAMPSRHDGGIHPQQHWEDVGGGESADVAVHPDNPNIVYATTYSGIITRKNLKTGETRDVGAYPHYTEGTKQRDLKYRWQWNFPIRVSKHNPDVLYHTSNYVHKSTDEGQRWEMISPDLTNDIDAYQDIPGGPIQHDGTGVEIYSTIFSFEEDIFEANTLWVGSDDGRMHITRNGGGSWEEITPKQMPKEGTVNAILPSIHKKGKAYAVIYRYRDGDPKPYIFKTENYGSSWTTITSGIPADHFARAIAEDSQVEGLLFAGTEFGMYISMNDGASWQPFQRNLPYTPVTDMEVRGNDLILSTQGRGFWIMDDISTLRSLKKNGVPNAATLFPISDTYRSTLGGYSGWGPAPTSKRYTADIVFYIPKWDSTQTASLKVMDAQNNVVLEKSTNAEESNSKLSVQQGMNMYSWNLQYPRPTLVEDLVMMDMRYPGQGPGAPSGKYTAVLTVNGDTKEQTFQLKKDPRWDITDKDLQQNFELASSVSALLTESQERIQNLRAIREQVEQTNSLLKKKEKQQVLISKGKELSEKSLELEDMIFQRKIETSQDEINYPRKFTNHLIRLYRVVLGQDNRPSAGELERWEDLQQQYKPFDSAYTQFMNQELKSYEAALKDANIPHVVVPH